MLFEITDLEKGAVDQPNRTLLIGLRTKAAGEMLGLSLPLAVARKVISALVQMTAGLGGPGPQAVHAPALLAAEIQPDLSNPAQTLLALRLATGAQVVVSMSKAQARELGHHLESQSRPSQGDVQ